MVWKLRLGWEDEREIDPKHHPVKRESVAHHSKSRGLQALLSETCCALTGRLERSRRFAAFLNWLGLELATEVEFVGIK